MFHNSKPRLDAVVAIVFLITSVFFLISSSKVKFNLFNSYPFISPDGFDWILQGQWLVSTLEGYHLDQLKILRDPIFVLVTALDAIDGGEGRVVLTVNALAFFITLMYVYKCMDLFGINTHDKFMFLMICVVSPLNYFRLSILADALTIALMQMSVYYLLLWDKNQVIRNNLLISAFWGLVAALCQKYGAIPFVVGTMSILSIEFLTYKRINRPAAVGIIIYLVVFLAISFLWRMAVPHSDVPNQLGLIKFSAAMVSFYANVWIWAFGFSLPVLIIIFYCLVRVDSKFISNKRIFILAAIEGVFMSLTFLYQWLEARFTFVHFFLFVTLVASAYSLLPENKHWIFKVKSFGLALATLVVFLTGMFFTPPDYWRPKLRALELNFRNSWVSQLVCSAPVNRLAIKPSVGSDQILWGEASTKWATDPYTIYTFEAYKKVMQIVKNGKSP